MILYSDTKLSAIHADSFFSTKKARFPGLFVVILVVILVVMAAQFLFLRFG